MEKYIASCVVQLKNRKGKPFQARLRYPDASKKKGWSEISRMVPEEIKSKREAGKWAEKWRAEMNAVADNMPSMEANKTKVRLGSILKALVTVELQLCSDLLIPLGSTNGVKDKIDRLFCSGLVSDNAVVIEVSDYREVKEALTGADV